VKRISSRLGLIFLAFFLLVAVSVVGTAWGLRAQSSDALAINLAGRQRMLIQWLARLADAPVSSSTETASLDAAALAFEETLQAFQHGGEVHYPADRIVRLDAAAEPAIQAQLARIETGWQGYQAALNTVQSTQPGAPQNLAARQAVQTGSQALLVEADALVRLYQAKADRRLTRLSWAQAVFFTGASLLLLGSVWMARRSILRPLRTLMTAAVRIGAGDLNTPVPMDGPLEMAALARAFDAMRSDLLASRQELLNWNQTLEVRVADRTRELDALHAVTREITARLEPEAVFRSVTDKARTLLNADTAFLCLLDPAECRLSLRSHLGPEGAVIRSVVETDNPFVSAVLCQAAGKGCSTGVACGACGIMAARFKRSHLAAPLWVEQRQIGALCVGSQNEAAFNADAPGLLERLAGAAAVAIENARLYRQAERLSALEERQRIAAEMHDGLAQTIDSIGLLVDQAGDCLGNGDPALALKALEKAYERVSRASKDVRASIASLEDEPPEPVSLQERLSELVEREKQEDAAGILWQVDLPPQEIFLSARDARNVLGIAGEALANARRHAGARCISMRLAVSGGTAALTIADDGCGFDPGGLPDDTQHPDGQRHFGMKILRARAAQLGGRLEIASQPGSGTRLNLRWPLQAPANAAQIDGRKSHA